MDETSSRLLQGGVLGADVTRCCEQAQARFGEAATSSQRAEAWPEVAWFKARGQVYPVECQLCLADLLELP